MPEPIQAPATPPTPAPAPTVTLTPGAPPVSTPPAPGTPAEPADDEFVSDRQRRRFAELTGRVGVRERERDEARARVHALLEREAERVAATTLAAPGDVWLDGATVADLLNEDGSDVDPAKVKAAVDAIIAKRPGLSKSQPPRPLPGGHALAPPGQKPTFAETIQEMTRGRI